MLISFVKAARLRTLPLSVSGIIVGGSLGISDKHLFQSPIFWLAILTTIGLQVLSNFANDYGDGIKGTDNKRIGEQRMVASGVISPSQMKKAVIITSVVTFFTSVALVYSSFGTTYLLYTLFFLLLGLLAIAAAIKYTVGTSAYGYSGYGDFFVFLFFGLLSVVGSYFLFTKQINLIIFLPAFTIGMLSVAVLNLNNMRDRVEDEKAKKRTLVVKIGLGFAKYYHYYLIIGSLLFSLLYVTLEFLKFTQFLFLIAYIPLLKHLYFVYKNKEESKFDSQLKIVALSTFLYSILFAFGVFL